MIDDIFKFSLRYAEKFCEFAYNKEIAFYVERKVSEKMNEFAKNESAVEMCEQGR